jgi:serine/threonine-protein kinase
MSTQGLSEIGPYQIGDRLGAGGMGEVYRAYDSRLDRSVAVKLIRPESSEDEVARERFRREARAAAGLSHPAIVQIHDIVAAGAGDAIIMELVEGESLAQKIMRGPLPVDECIRLAREIIEGLAAAHSRKILHRDLKPENVMVTPDGHVKILDFGLAKQLGDEESLTRTAAVIGTFRCMSPEQARGMVLDHRSDLFSFGVLLYEMLTGQSPFRSGVATDTLVRICTARQRPVREVRPEVPSELSALVDALLEKDPDLRPRSARGVAQSLGRIADQTANAGEATLVEVPAWEAPPLPAVAADAIPLAGRPRKTRWALAIAAGLLLAVAVAAAYSRLSRVKPVTVAVTRSEILTPTADESVHRLASGLQAALLQGLASLEGVYPLASESVDPVPGTPIQVARATAADEVLTSKLDCGAAVCQVSLARIGGRNGNVLWAQSIEVPIEKPYLLAEAVQSHLRIGYGGHAPRRDASRMEVSPEDYARYLVLLREADQKQSEELSPDALARLAAIRRSSPRFLEAFLFEARALQRRFQFQRDPADLDRAAALLREARELAPEDLRPVEVLCEISLKAHRPEQAEEAVRQMERLQPGSYAAQVFRARLLEQQEKRGEALDLIRQVARRNPSWQHLYWAARMTYRNGHQAEGRGYLEELLTKFPDYSIGKSLLGEWELLTGSPQRAVELYGDLVRSHPEATELSQLGLAYLLLHQYGKAEEEFGRAVELAPRNPLVALNLADARLLLGKKESAAALYRQIIDWVAADAGGPQVQLLSARAQALAHLGERRGAVEAAQKMLRMAPDDAQVALDVALVYTVVGDRVSALTHAQRALEGGVEPRWFAFPWFAPLQSSAEFQQLGRGTSPR